MSVPSPVSPVEFSKLAALHLVLQIVNGHLTGDAYEYRASIDLYTAIDLY